jgi:hypothetical protein
MLERAKGEDTIQAAMIRAQTAGAQRPPTPDAMVRMEKNLREMALQELGIVDLGAGLRFGPPGSGKSQADYMAKVEELRKQFGGAGATPTQPQSPVNPTPMRGRFRVIGQE